MTNATDDVLIARAALIALRQTVPEAQRPQSPFFAFLPNLEAVDEGSAAKHLASLQKPAFCLGTLAFDALAIAAWPASDVPADADVRSLYRTESPLQPDCNVVSSRMKLHRISDRNCTLFGPDLGVKAQPRNAP